MAVSLEDFIFDYRLGYVRAGCEMPGFDVLGGGDGPMILTLGGYATPGMAGARRGWADFLHAAFKAGGRNVRIINGDTDGYTSAQETLALMRDGILLKPELVICLSGFYNFAYNLGFLKEDERQYADVLHKYPFTNPVQLEFFKGITARFGLGAAETRYGGEYGAPAWELWLEHADIIHCLCEEFGIRHITFLQPCVFSGSYRLSAEESSGLADLYGISETALEGFREGFRDAYEAAAEGAKERGYITDLSGLFDGDAGAYQDACHLKDRCAEKLAGAICREAVKRMALPGVTGHE